MNIDPSAITKVAIPFMQKTHEEEIAMLNKIYGLLDTQTNNMATSELSQHIEDLAMHTHAHFAREEEEMRNFSFPPYTVHKRAHDEYLEQFNSILNTWRQSSDLAPLAHFLQKTTPVWMQQHISTMDYATANFFAACNKGT